MTKTDQNRPKTSKSDQNRRKQNTTESDKNWYSLRRIDYKHDRNRNNLQWPNHKFHRTWPNMNKSYQKWLTQPKTAKIILLEQKRLKLILLDQNWPKLILLYQKRIKINPSQPKTTRSETIKNKQKRLKTTNDNFGQNWSKMTKHYLYWTETS